MTLFHHDPHDYLCDTYDTEQCKDIANYGCISGAATCHITYKDTVEFFDQYEERISDDYELIFDEPIVKAAVNAGFWNHTRAKESLQWQLQEAISQPVSPLTYLQVSILLAKWWKWGKYTIGSGVKILSEEKSKLKDEMIMHAVERKSCQKAEKCKICEKKIVCHLMQIQYT